MSWFFNVVVCRLSAVETLFRIYASAGVTCGGHVISPEKYQQWLKNDIILTPLHFIFNVGTKALNFSERGLNFCGFDC